MRIRRIATTTLLLMLLASCSLAASHPDVRIKDLADVEGVRSNQLVGLGLVMGLQGTGDRSAMAVQMIRNMMGQFGITVGDKAVRSRNVAVVTLTAELPAFARPGQTIDVTASAMGDAKSLQGGTLLQTPLKAADGNIYAVAQGPLLVGGFVAEGAGGAMTKNIVTVGRIPGGAIVERDVPTRFTAGRQINLLLRNPDFTTSERMASAINSAFGSIAAPIDAGRVAVSVPPQYEYSPASFVAKLETLSVRPDTAARVAVNERTGTVVMGGDVRIGAVAVAHGSLTVRVTESPEVSQPAPFSRGTTSVQPRTDVDVEEPLGQFIALEATSTVEELVDALNSVGASPRDVIAILQAIKEAGALHGELVVM
ncbi:MAG: flagellar basal body P-ring protein FlgI [Synergistaceae bacterium]|nr:flagellar basal body P-ring protein FlgI [Synergistota bacterium]NLM71026.1 flagellar basal body P-ring protein FlgI [Synergistaceae bacterium]